MANLSKVFAAAGLAVVLAACGGGGGKAGDGDSSKMPEPDPPKIGELGPGLAINSALTFGNWSVLTRPPSSAPGTDDNLLPATISDVGLVERHLSSQEIRGLTGSYTYKGIAEVKRGDRTWPMQNMEVSANFDADSSPYVTISGWIKNPSAPTPFQDAIGFLDSGITGIVGYGGPGVYDPLQLISSSEPASRVFNFHDPTSESVTAETMSIFVSSNSDAFFGAFGYAFKDRE